MAIGTDGSTETRAVTRHTFASDQERIDRIEDRLRAIEAHLDMPDEVPHAGADVDPA